ncbi:MAG: hypothetical protein E7304_07960 [Butyrivibrio sp.]|uniref:hypothetical protein n=1 Tax=Butyrivibrio sp. TaxID=28121 RepID=UPI001EB92BF3|nr:hypothetical protein [Butyrivibrio sp.]MBE5841323.1 hypothetical protein [Butyrivibrio sp.]
MKDLDIRINLDPVNDKILNFPVRNNPGDGKNIKNQKAVVIGTNGTYRTVDVDEMDRIMTALGDNGIAKSLSENYVMLFSTESIINAEFTRYLVGSVLVMKIGDDSRIKNLTDFDIDMMRTFFETDLVTLTYGKEKFDAYPLEYEDVA